MSEYTEKAEAICKELGLTVKFELMTVVRNPWGRIGKTFDVNYHDKYRVTLKKDGHQRSFYFYDSASNSGKRFHDKANYRKLGAYDFLACVTIREPDSDILDFCAEYGYPLETSQERAYARKVHNGVKREFEKMSALFSPDELERLAEIA